MQRRFRAASSTTKDGAFVVTGGWSKTMEKPTFIESFKNGTWEKGPELPFEMAKHCQVTTEAGVIVAGKEI